MYNKYYNINKHYTLILKNIQSVFLLS